MSDFFAKISPNHLAAVRCCPAVNIIAGLKSVIFTLSGMKVSFSRASNSAAMNWLGRRQLMAWCCDVAFVGRRLQRRADVLI